MKKILIIGATSAIASATARIWASEGHSFYLVGRNELRLSAIGDELRKLGAAQVLTHVADLANLNDHDSMITTAFTALGEVDIALVAHGVLGDQKASEINFSLALQEININLLSTMSLITNIANHFQQQEYGTIAAISSVAGDRGRQSNYIYGTAKGSLNIFLEGLRHRLHKHNINVLTIKPGLVDTPMTHEFKKGFLWASDSRIASDIARAVRKRKDEIYTPWFWRFVMFAITLLPRSIYKRTNL